MFFHDGKIVARYKIRDLLVRPQLVTHSVSHVHWLYSPIELELATFEMTTSSLRRYTFDVATGKQLKADDADEWKRCDAIAYAGTRMHVAAGIGTIDRPRSLRATSKERCSSRSRACHSATTRPG